MEERSCILLSPGGAVYCVKSRYQSWYRNSGETGCGRAVGRSAKKKLSLAKCLLKYVQIFDGVVFHQRTVIQQGVRSLFMSSVCESSVP